MPGSTSLAKTLFLAFEPHKCLVNQVLARIPIPLLSFFGLSTLEEVPVTLCVPMCVNTPPLSLSYPHSFFFLSIFDASQPFFLPPSYPPLFSCIICVTKPQLSNYGMYILIYTYTFIFSYENHIFSVILIRIRYSTERTFNFFFIYTYTMFILYSFHPNH